MSEAIIVAAISLIGTIITVWAANKITGDGKSLD